jgi:hypothetical protein
MLPLQLRRQPGPRWRRGAVVREPCLDVEAYATFMRSVSGDGVLNIARTHHARNNS